MKLRNLFEMDEQQRQLGRSQDPQDRLRYFAQQFRTGQLTPDESEELTRMARDGDAEAAKLAVRVPDCILNELVEVLQLARQFLNWDLGDDVFPEAYVPIVPYGQEAFVAYQQACMGVRSSSYWNSSGRDSDNQRAQEAYQGLRNTLNDLNGDFGLRDRAAERDLDLPILARSIAPALPSPPVDQRLWEMPDHNGADGDPDDYDPPDWDL